VRRAHGDHATHDLPRLRVGVAPLDEEGKELKKLAKK